MRVTAKGQVTIPKPVRDRLGLRPGSEVEFIDAKEGVRLVRRSKASDHRQRSEEFQAWAESVKGLLPTGGLDGKAYVDQLRGLRDDLDAG